MGKSFTQAENGFYISAGAVAFIAGSVLDEDYPFEDEEIDDEDFIKLLGAGVGYVDDDFTNEFDDEP